MPRNPPDDGKLAHGRHRLTMAESDAIIAVAVAAELRRLRCDDIPRCRMSKKTNYEHAHHISVRAQTAKRLEQKGLIRLPLCRVWGERSEYGDFPVLTEEGRAALASRWDVAVVARAERLFRGTIN